MELLRSIERALDSPGLRSFHARMIMRHYVGVGLTGLLALALSGACGDGGSTSSSGGPGGAGASVSSSTGGPLCKPGGASCASFAECCSATCANNVCTSCAQNGEACAVDADCCPGTECDGGVCTFTCDDDGSSCTLASECCSNVCSAGECVGDCTDQGGSCAADIYCCSNVCEGGACAACAGEGKACNNDAQCCSDQCLGGTCLCPSGVHCQYWLTGGGNYNEVCPASKPLAAAVIDCICTPCGNKCSNCTKYFDRGYSPSQACTDCITGIFASCNDELQACYAD